MTSAHFLLTLRQGGPFHCEGRKDDPLHTLKAYRRSGGTAPLIPNFGIRSKYTVLFPCCLCSVKCVRETYLVEAGIPQMVESSYSRRAHIVTRSFIEGPLTKPISLIFRHVCGRLSFFTHSHAPSAITTTAPKRAISGTGLRMRRVAHCKHS
jgi:hypothetical protein